MRFQDKFDSLNAQFSGFENGAGFWATMPKACPKDCGVFDVRWNALLGLSLLPTQIKLPVLCDAIP